MDIENQAIKNYAAKLAERSEKLNQLSLSDWSNMSKKDLLPNKGFYIYAIFAKDSYQVDSIINGFNKCKNKCNKCKHENPVKHFPQDNGHNCKENCIYIGSSKSLKQRIKEHFDDNCKTKTYALHLKCYYQHELIVKYIQINERELMQDVEDALWDYYKPIFGKRGKK